MTPRPQTAEKQWQRTLARNRPSRLAYALLGLVAGFLAGLLLVGTVYYALELLGLALFDDPDDAGLALIGAFLMPPLCGLICAIWGFFGGERMLRHLEALWNSHPHAP